MSDPLTVLLFVSAHWRVPWWLSGPRLPPSLTEVQESLMCLQHTHATKAAKTTCIRPVLSQRRAPVMPLSD